MVLEPIPVSFLQLLALTLPAQAIYLQVLDKRREKEPTDNRYQNAFLFIEGSLALIAAGMLSALLTWTKLEWLKLVGLRLGNAFVLSGYLLFAAGIGFSIRNEKEIREFLEPRKSWLKDLFEQFF